MSDMDSLTEIEIFELADQATTALMDYLTEHENDIALGLGDYGVLKSPFHWSMGRVARPTVTH